MRQTVTKAATRERGAVRCKLRRATTAKRQRTECTGSQLHRFALTLCGVHHKIRYAISSGLSNKNAGFTHIYLTIQTFNTAGLWSTG